MQPLPGRAEPVAAPDRLADGDRDVGQVRVAGAQAVGVQHGHVQAAADGAGEDDRAGRARPDRIAWCRSL